MGGGEGVAFKYFFGTADYSVGDPRPLVYVGWVLAQNIAFFMSSPALLATGWPISSKKPYFLGAKKGVFGLEKLFLHSNGRKWVKMSKMAQQHPF